MATSISNQGPEASIDYVMQASRSFGIDEGEAREIIGSVAQAVSEWRQVGRKLGLTDGDLSPYETAFEHAEAVVFYQGPPATPLSIAHIASTAAQTTLVDPAGKAVAVLGREDRFQIEKGSPLWAIEIADKAAETIFESAQSDGLRDLMFLNIGMTSRLIRKETSEPTEAPATPKPKVSKGSSFIP